MEQSLRDRVNEDTLMKIEILNPDKRKKFNDLLMDRLYDRGWCGGNGIDYVTPNIAKAKVKTYNEMVRYGLVKGKDN